jgi:hypothetical protein
MNTYLPASWEGRVTRLHLGVDPVDAVDPTRVPGRPPSAVAVVVEKVPRPHPLPARPDDTVGLPALHRSRTGRFALLFGVPTTDSAPRIAVRIVDPAGRYVPRRLSVPVPDLAAVLAADDADPKPPRTFRPVLFPGPWHGTAPGTTVLFGRVVRPGPDREPVPWARIEAGLAGSGMTRWRAHADRDGAFVLVVGPLPAPAATALTGLVDIDVTVHAPPPPSPTAPVDSPTGSRTDPLHLLPVEQVAALEGGDPAEDGTAIPPGHTLTVSATVRLTRGRPLRPAPFVVT